MYYNEISGVKVSALGMGNMRLPKIEGQGEQISRPSARSTSGSRRLCRNLPK